MRSTHKTAYKELEPYEDLIKTLEKYYKDLFENLVRILTLLKISIVIK